jgi:hypothetical protein
MAGIRLGAAVWPLYGLFEAGTVVVAPAILISVR